MLPKRGWRWPLYDSFTRHVSHSRAGVSAHSGTAPFPLVAGDRLRVLTATPARGAWPMSFLPLRARKAVVEAGSVRDGP